MVHAWRLEGESMLRGGLMGVPESEVDERERLTFERHKTELAAQLAHWGMGLNDPVENVLHVCPKRPMGWTTIEFSDLMVRNIRI